MQKGECNVAQQRAKSLGTSKGEKIKEQDRERKKHSQIPMGITDERSYISRRKRSSRRGSFARAVARGALVTQRSSMRAADEVLNFLILHMVP
jgi:hypothetical protein